MTVILDKNGHAITDSVITVYSYTPDTHEYIGCVDEYLSTGIGLPANSTILSPGNVPSGSVAIYENGAWNVQPDLRGKTAYSTEDLEAIIIDYIGEIHSGFTLLVPGKFDRWDGNQWVTDSEAKHTADVETADAVKVLKTDQANEHMNSKQWPGKAAMGRLKDSEKVQYNAWLDYLDALEAVDTSTAPEIAWPAIPS